jgi:predicted DNA-binding transcriptional regulator AlpA
MSTNAKQNSPIVDFDDCIIPLSEIAHASDLSMATLRRRIADGTGPQITKTSERRLGVRGSHYREWLDAQGRRIGAPSAVKAASKRSGDSVRTDVSAGERPIGEDTPLRSGYWPNHSTRMS